MSIIHIPSYKYRNPEEGAFPWATCSSLPLIYYQGPTVFCQCHVSGFVFFSCDLGMVHCRPYRGFRSPDGPSSLPPFLTFLPSLRNSHRCGARAGGTRLPTSFLYEFPTKRMWVYFSFPSSSSGMITQHCSPNRDRHEGCVFMRRLQRGFAIPALLASSYGPADGPPGLVWMVIVVRLQFQEQLFSLTSSISRGCLKFIFLINKTFL